ncbi:hypothetical protein NSA19_09715 [Actinomyces bowdenii]|uniref:hypothetical protein n=1 Tax=Actinomyces bowdenii TaxID=131109 RepID=UPI00214C3723|nr:hypothetical protein [Actinomyces bowdenii]MCR2053112.1 hypothetical protein [Actinomyces bowdenii]
MGRSNPYLHTLRGTLERRSSSTAYSPEPLEADLLLATVREALVEEERTWQGQGVGDLEVFVLLLRPRGGQSRASTACASRAPTWWRPCPPPSRSRA